MTKESVMIKEIQQREASMYQTFDAVGVALIAAWVIWNQDAVMVASLLSLILETFAVIRHTPSFYIINC